MFEQYTYNMNIKKTKFERLFSYIFASSHPLTVKKRIQNEEMQYSTQTKETINYKSVLKH